MNERIRQLTEQCYEHDQSWTGVGQRIFNKEKFAELIVKECISVINTEAAEVPVEDEYERMWKMGTEFAVYQIEKHFGVEE
jgi:exo-beta-1,3-glucanase (GH17 family)